MGYPHDTGRSAGSNTTDEHPGANPPTEPPMPAREALGRALLLAAAEVDDEEPDYWAHAAGWESLTGVEADRVLEALARLGWRLHWEGGE
jgi:hypothetical protein